MRTSSLPGFLGTLLTFFLVPACGNSGKGSPPPALAEVLVWNTPQAQYLVPRKATLPLAIETVTLRHSGTVGEVEYALDDPTGTLKASPSTGVLAPGEAVAISISVIALTAYETVVVNMTCAYTGDTAGDPLEVKLPFPLMPPAMYVLSLLTGDARVPALFTADLVIGSVGAVVQHISAGTLRNRIPALGFTEIVAIGLLTLDQTRQKLDANFRADKSSTGPAVVFPPGKGPIGLTIHADKEVPMTPGAYHMFHMTTRDPIPLQDPDPKNLHTYAFFLDSDGDGANNWVPTASFPNAFWKGTDRWYQIEYTNAAGWNLKVTQVDSTNTATEVDSAARLILVEDGIVLVVPKSEVPGPNAKWRASTFVHQGDFGMNSPYLWSGDVEPPVDKPLVPIK